MDASPDLPLTAADVGVAAESPSDLPVEHVRRLAATLAVQDDVDDIGVGDALPLLWHWAFFAPAVPTAGVGVDGHPRLPEGGPLAGFTSRMWAGGRVVREAPLLAGVPAVRRSAVDRVERKSGRSGELVVVTVRHEIEQRGVVAVRELQDLVYRGRGAPAALPVGDERPPAPAGGWADPLVMGPVRLFRFSAVTFNSHRIHYDKPYATGEEGYPGLVVHGPLTALLLAESARRRGFAANEFEYRASAPLFADVPFTVVGAPEGVAVDLRAVRNDGLVAMSARSL